MKWINNKKRYILIILFFSIVSAIFQYLKIDASTKMTGIEQFPESYQGYLRELSKRHPNWKFTALYTNLDWKYVINQENIFGKNLVPKNYSDNWKNTKNGQYNVEVDKNWVDSSRQAVEFCMDPRNFLNEVRIFQFEGLSYDNTTNNLDGIEKILYGTEFYNRQVSYYDTYGNAITMNEKYSDLILRAGKKSNVSPYHLASRIKQEVGPFITHSSISGTVDGYRGLYNFYNIGATSSAEPMGAIKNGLQYARDGKGADEATKNKYLIPWDNKEKSITGGAIFIGSSYINVGQNTVYQQKFDVNDDRSNELFWHQYMTNVLAPYSESKSIYNGYQKMGLLDTPISFIIPVYENMPQIPVQSPDISYSDFKEDDTKVYCNSSNVNLRSGPSTSYEVITKLSEKEEMTRIGKGVQSAEKWDKVLLENGIIGYIYQIYDTEMPEKQPDIENNTVKNEIEVPEKVEVTGITLDKEEIYLNMENNFQINAKIEPENAEEKEVLYETSNQEIATIDENGLISTHQEGETVIIAKSKENENIKAECKIIVVRKLENNEIETNEQLIISDLEITGIDYEKNKVQNIIENFKTSLEIEIVNNKNEILEDTDIVGTGNKVRFKENEKILKQYEIVIFGDVDGDGKITSKDLLVLQRHILELEKLKPIFMRAANIRKNGQLPSSLDLLLIQRHILELQLISQTF